MKTIYFYGITALGFSCALMLIDPNVSAGVNYHYGATSISFDLKDKKKIGKALSRTFKRKDFRQVQLQDI